ncbi:hypothetical protein BD626DRAFT_276086 [Schizophyllum amplum]|uniref:Uncharacterized protein n=1 Tax=Schizophyllum amplum TaxID=97359 RepID=A0A550CFZ9_9AGAR|nr:hypothetical protein BD626DRAFT_276086 [Auriculariopsis ampla]
MQGFLAVSNPSHLKALHAQGRFLPTSHRIPQVSHGQRWPCQPPPHDGWNNAGQIMEVRRSTKLCSEVRCKSSLNTARRQAATWQGLNAWLCKNPTRGSQIDGDTTRRSTTTNRCLARTQRAAQQGPNEQLSELTTRKPNHDAPRRPSKIARPRMVCRGDYYILTALHYILTLNYCKPIFVDPGRYTPRSERRVFYGPNTVFFSCCIWQHLPFGATCDARLHSADTDLHARHGHGSTRRR